MTEETDHRVTPAQAFRALLSALDIAPSSEKPIGPVLRPFDDERLLAKIDELIGAVNASRAPAIVRWGNSKTIAALLDMKPRTFLECLACKPNFPKPFRSSLQTIRWNVSEVEEWLLEERNRQRAPRTRERRPERAKS